MPENTRPNDASVDDTTGTMKNSAFQMSALSASSTGAPRR